MIRSVVVFILFIGVVGVSAQAQEKLKKSARPNLPGSFLVDFGVNRGLSAPDDFKQGFLGSRTLNLYYQYPIRLWKSKFSLVPGMGLGLERFKFTNLRTLESDPKGDGAYDLVKADTIYANATVKKSMLVANYFDIPIEVRFDTHPEDISRSFNIAVGVRAGVLLDAFTKLKYKEDGETKIFKDKQNHGLNDIRYGFYTRLGIGGFNWFAFYNSSQLFKTDKGPNKTNMNTITLGISINGF